MGPVRMRWKSGAHRSVKRKEREAGARGGGKLGRHLLAGPMGGRLGKTSWAKRPPGRGQGWCFSFFIPFSKPFLNIILNAK